MTNNTRAPDETPGGEPASAATAPPTPAKISPAKTAPKDARQNDRNLDDGIEDSMDGSDPPSSIQP